MALMNIKPGNCFFVEMKQTDISMRRYNIPEEKPEMMEILKRVRALKLQKIARGQRRCDCSDNLFQDFGVVRKNSEILRNYAMRKVNQNPPKTRNYY